MSTRKALSWKLRIRWDSYYLILNMGQHSALDAESAGNKKQHMPSDVMLLPTVQRQSNSLINKVTRTRLASSDVVLETAVLISRPLNAVFGGPVLVLGISRS